MHLFLAKTFSMVKIYSMNGEVDRKKVVEKAVELGYAARIVIQQLVAKDRTPEGFAAQELLERAITSVVIDRIDEPKTEAVAA